MLTFNNLTFAPMGAKGTDVATGHHGLYLRSPRGVHLYKPTGELEAHIVNSAQQGRFIVSAHTYNGQPRYMFSTTSLTEKWLAIEGVSLSKTDDLIETMH